MENKVECEIVQDLLLSYVDDVLNPESKKLVEKHLLNCSKCKERLKNIRKDVEDNKENERKEIDYLKKIKIQGIIKSIILTAFMIIIIIFAIYLRKFIIINSLYNKASNYLENGNLYEEKRSRISDDMVIVEKTYYKDGKCKIIREQISDSGKKLTDTIYRAKNSDEIITISHEYQKVYIQKDQNAKNVNNETNFLYIPFMTDRDDIKVKISKAFLFRIDTDTFEIGKEYYVLTNKKSKQWEIWIDKETGLPIKEINKNGMKSWFPGTDIVKSVNDNIQDYIFKRNIVTDEDVQIPDLSNYEIEYTN